MRFFVCFFAIMAVVTAALVLLLNVVDAAPGVAVAALTSVCVAGGATLGYFADRLPD